MHSGPFGELGDPTIQLFGKGSTVAALLMTLHLPPNPLQDFFECLQLCFIETSRIVIINLDHFAQLFVCPVFVIIDMIDVTKNCFAGDIRFLFFFIRRRRSESIHQFTQLTAAKNCINLERHKIRIASRNLICRLDTTVRSIVLFAVDTNQRVLLPKEVIVLIIIVIIAVVCYQTFNMAIQFGIE